MHDSARIKIEEVVRTYLRGNFLQQQVKFRLFLGKCAEHGFIRDCVESEV
jgi:hypothetical protein